MFNVKLSVLILISFIGSGLCLFEDTSSSSVATGSKAELKSTEFWTNDATGALMNKLALSPIKNVAKNVIIFVGDGLSLATITAARIYEGQQKKIIGERNRLVFEKFHNVGLLKSYCVDKQVADSACATTSLLSSVRVNFETLGLSPNVSFNNCQAARLKENHLENIFHHAQEVNKSTGFVTNTRVTHATPAAIYAHTPNRHYESDADINGTSANCVDIARQLIENPVAEKLNVILGGGHNRFLPNNVKDVESKFGLRTDGRNLVNEWVDAKKGSGVFVSNIQSLEEANKNLTDYVLGLFSSDNMPFNLDKGRNVPTLTLMTETAINVLAKNKKGFLLFVEGGRIDHAHHKGKAVKALDETIQLARAVEKALELTNENDTLIIVTSDHSHTMTISGASNLDNSIVGASSIKSDVDDLPYATLNYANGPEALTFFEVTGNKTFKRSNLSYKRDIGRKDFVYPQMFPMKQGTHEGSDVPLYANGPWAHLFGGVNEQTTIPALISYGSCIGSGPKVCDKKAKGRKGKKRI